MCIKKETTFKDDEIVVVVNNNNDDQKSVSFVFGRERVFVVARFVTNMNWRQIRLHFSNSILYIYPKTKRERACSLRARTRKRGEPRDAAKRRRQQQHHHRFRRRERKRSETSSCVIISIHNIHVFFATVFPIEYSSVESMRTRTTTRPCVSENRKTFFADPFFSLFFFLFLLPFLRANNNNSLFQRGDGNDKLGGDVETGRWGGNAAEIRLPSNG